MANGTCMYDSLKNPKNYFPNIGINSFQRNFFFNQNSSKKLYFWPFLSKSLINLVSLHSSIDVRKCAIALQTRNKKPYEMGGKSFQNFAPKNSKKMIFAKNIKNDQKIENVSKKFLVGIDLELSQTYFKTIKSSLKIFFHCKIFFRDIAVFSKNGT